MGCPMSLSDEQPRTRLVLPDDEPDFGPRRPRRPRWVGLVVVLAVFAVVIGALAIINRAGRTDKNQASTTPTTTSTHPSSHPTTAPPATTVSTTPFANTTFPTGTATVYDVPVGYADTLAGAESAAVNYAVVYGSAPMATTSSRHVILNAIADPAIAASLKTQLDTAYAAFDASLGIANGTPAGMTLVMRTLPVGETVTANQPGRVTVGVWVDLLSGLSGSNTAHPVSEQWETLAVTVHRVDGDWKWAGFTETDGPTPVTTSQNFSSNEALKSAIQQFGGLRYAP
jgi:hypothetical protein